MIFDMDGVLSDTEKSRFLILKKILKKEGISLDESYSKKFIGLKLERIFSKYFKDKHLDVSRIRKEKDRIIQSHPEKYILGYPGTKECLQRLSDDGLQLAVCSSSKKESIHFALTSLGILGFFSLIISSDEVKEQKPSPEIYLLALRKLCLTPSECLVIEDSKIGIEAAHRAGIKCIGITSNFQKDELKEADRVVSSLDEINTSLIRLFENTN